MIKKSNVFNSPIETGLRSLILLEAGYPKSFDIERIVFYDYLLVHSGDIKDGPKSIHPNTPHRSGELLVRRPVIEKGLDLMISRGLLTKEYSESGFEYKATELSTPFLDTLDAGYTKKIIGVASWVIESFDDESNEEIRSLIRNNLGVWGGEFLGEAILRAEDA
ncbi:threonine transporter [Vibrio coralliilyticus]|uniref:ABC-three component system middle component 2 n=1 Tax=Vibrio coralliilyticus TaxID=190893 RepID=UPI0005FA6AFF|nr:ABC-three component system middle component 2 [Vibrio coralliilyticus]QOU31009.1 threonine transporter [Vibrio coralliilyticus]